MDSHVATHQLVNVIQPKATTIALPFVVSARYDKIPITTSRRLAASFLDLQSGFIGNGGLALPSPCDSEAGWATE